LSLLACSCSSADWLVRIDSVKRREFIGLSLAGGALSLFDRSAFAAVLSAGGRPKTLVLGGGAFAMGYALAHPKDTLVLERGIHLGLDYAGTTGPVAPGTPTTEIGRELVAKMAEAQILKDGAMELPPLADFLAQFFTNHGGQAFMNADLVDLKKTSDGYRLSIVGGGSEGLSQFNVGGFVDTTDVGWRDFGADAVVSKRFGGIAPDFTYFNVDLAPTAGWHEARIALYDAWKKAGHQPKELLAETNAIKCFYGADRVERRHGEFGYVWTPSGQFADLVSAFEEGYKWTAA